jgi:2-keto-3-deoxy-L-rhamnonate aldolase RhmA
MRYDTRRPSAIGLDLMARLAGGVPVYALGIRFARSPDIARMASMAGYDLLWVDLEHCGMSIDVAGQILSCAHDLGLGAWVRVPENDFGVIGRLLDSGATGIILPRVETEAQAQRLAACCRFPPAGERSMIARLPQSGFSRLPAAELTAAANGQTVCQALIESRLGVRNADGIAATDGIDILAIGANDLTAEMGFPGDVRRPEFVGACKAVADAARRHDKAAIIGGIAVQEDFIAFLKSGFSPFVFTGIDTDIVADGIAARRNAWRERLAEQDFNCE